MKVFKEKDKNLIESVQRRAKRIIRGLKSKFYEERLKIMKLPSLCYRSLRGGPIDVYKYTPGLYKVSEGLIEFETRTNTDMWNCLPDYTVDASRTD
jgi:hypothetical protein